MIEDGGNLPAEWTPTQSEEDLASDHRLSGDDTEVPRAYVVADKNKISEEDIKNLVKEKLAPYKQLRGGVIYMDEIPRNTVGKILRKDLREMAKKDGRARL